MKPSPVSEASPQDLATLVHGERRRKSAWGRVLLVSLLLAAGAAGWYWWARAQKARIPVSPYITEPLKRGDLSLSITATGNLEPTNEVTVGSELSGTTLEVYVDINDHVTKGQPLAKLDMTKLLQQTESTRAAVTSAKARVSVAQATLKETEASLARLRELSKLSNGRAVSQAELDTATASVDRAQAELLNAEAAVGEAEARVKINESDLEKSVIKSPIDGIVLTRSVEPGQTVAASFTAPELFIIAEKLEHMQLDVAVAEADIGNVSAGQKATFMVDAWPNRVYNAVVKKVSYGSAVTDNVVTYVTELEVANDDLSLRPGMTATADIHVAERKGVLLVPSAALRFDPAAATALLAGNGKGEAPKKSFVQSIVPARRFPSSSRRKPEEGSSRSRLEEAKVWVLRDGKPESLPVTIGLSDGGFSEVSGEGIEEGLPIIVRVEPPAAS